MKKVFLTLTHYNYKEVTSEWYIKHENTGLGNMLFQVASGLAYAKKNNARLFVPSLETYFANEEIEKEDSIFRNINTRCPLDYHTSPILEITDSNIHMYEFYDGIHFIDHFERYENFHEYRDMIVDTFSPTQKDIDYITSKYPFIFEDNVSSLHIRLGPDYKQIQNLFDSNILDFEMRYHFMLDHMIKERGIKAFFVLTNDKEYCSNLLDKNERYTGITFIYSEEKDYMDLWMISLMKNNILSVSTLAWWGSYLNNNPDRYIICAKNNRDNLQLDEWVKVDRPSNLSNFVIRELNINDYEKYLKMVNVFRPSEFSQDQFVSTLNNMQYMSKVLVIESENDIIATATVVFERKFIHNICTLARIEDLCVKPEYRKLGLGKILVENLIKIARMQGCYKVTLTCKDELINFYEKCGLQHTGAQMSTYL